MKTLRPFRNITPRLGARVYIDPAATVIGDVELGDDVSVWPGAVVRGDVEHVRIGPRTNIQDGAIIHETHAGPYSGNGFPCTVGADVTIGHAAVVHACTIEDCCLIGIQATILDGAVIHHHAFVGAGALVAPGKVVRAGELWVGNPARFARKLSDRDLEALAYSAQHYVKVKDEYLAALQA